MEVDILKLIGYVTIILIIVVIYAVVTVELDIEDKSCIFPIIVVVLMFLLVAIMNKDIAPTYKLDKVLVDSDIEIKDDKVYVGDIEIEDGNIYSLNFYKGDNYLVESDTYVHLCPGLKMHSNDKILVVNKDVVNNTLDGINVLKINNSVDLYKFVNELHSNKNADKNYDKSISGILGKSEEETEKENVKDIASEDNGVNTKEDIESLTELKNSIDNIEKELESLDSSELEQKVSAIESEVSTLKTNLEKLEKEIKEVRNTKNQTNQLIISDANIRTIVASVVVLVLLSIFVYGRVIKINTNSKKELLVTASEAKIREGVMLDNKE